jgi:hypothetical protein
MYIYVHTCIQEAQTLVSALQATGYQGTATARRLGLHGRGGVGGDILWARDLEVCSRVAVFSK